MSYSYTIKLQLAYANSNVRFNCDPFRQTLLDAADDYNLCSGNAPNPKSIYIENIYPSSFIVVLTSQNELSSPGKALRAFSKIVVDSGVFSECIKHAKLFTTYTLTDISKNTNENPDPGIISDAELIKALVDYALNKTESDSTAYNRKRNAVTHMKQIALEAGILSSSTT